MYAVITIIHVLACIFLVLVVLLQTGKGAEMGAVFGGSSSTVFGSSGAGNFLTRLTTATAIIFMFTSLGLTYLSARRTASTVFDDAPLAAPAVEQGAPAAPQPETGTQAGQPIVVEAEGQFETEPAGADAAAPAALAGGDAIDAVAVEEAVVPDAGSGDTAGGADTAAENAPQP